MLYRVVINEFPGYRMSWPATLISIVGVFFRCRKMDDQSQDTQPQSLGIDRERFFCGSWPVLDDLSGQGGFEKMVQYGQGGLHSNDPALHEHPRPRVNVMLP